MIDIGCMLDNHHGFKTRKCPSRVEDMNQFEVDLWSMVETVKFCRVNDELQNKLKDNLSRIRASKDVLVSADKTRNVYEVRLAQYEKLLNDNVTKHYKHASRHACEAINKEAKEIPEDLHIAERAEILAQKDAYVKLKDHKENFQQSLPCRLINPSKSEIGRVSKTILSGIVRDVKGRPQLSKVFSNP